MSIRATQQLRSTSFRNIYISVHTFIVLVCPGKLVALSLLRCPSASWMWPILPAAHHFFGVLNAAHGRALARSHSRQFVTPNIYSASRSRRRGVTAQRELRTHVRRSADVRLSATTDASGAIATTNGTHSSCSKSTAQTTRNSRAKTGRTPYSGHAQPGAIGNSVKRKLQANACHAVAATVRHLGTITGESVKGLMMLSLAILSACMMPLIAMAENPPIIIQGNASTSIEPAETNRVPAILTPAPMTEPIYWTRPRAWHNDWHSGGVRALAW